MKSVKGWPIGVCSWSMHDDIDTIHAVMERQGLSHLHLHVGALKGDKGEQMRGVIDGNDWTITSTMLGFPQEDYSTIDRIRETGGVAPDAEWPANRDSLAEAIATTASLNVPFLSFHAGFLDHSDADYAAKFETRIRDAADIAQAAGIMLIMETGQESANDLRQFMETLAHPALGINYDPANMILYDKDHPIDAVGILGPWIKHVHIKDAIRTETSGTWGTEVPWGDGEVDSTAFLNALEAVGYDGALAIEREAGENRDGDVELAVTRLLS